MSANFFKFFCLRLNKKIISDFLLFSFFLKPGVDFTSAIMLSWNPRLSYGTYISWLWAVHSRPSGSFCCENGCRGGGWRQKLPYPPYAFLPQLFLYAPFSHGIWLQSSCHRCLWLSVYFPGACPVFQAFSVILTDNGASFKNPSVFERKNGQNSHTLIFYCDPMASWQKGRLEKDHEFIRYVLPKGTTFSGLTQPKATWPITSIVQQEPV